MKLFFPLRLDDFENSCAAYEKAIELGPDDYVTHLNYTITLYSNDEIERARKQFGRFKVVFENVKEDHGDVDADIMEQYELLKQYLNN